MQVRLSPSVFNPTICKPMPVPIFVSSFSSPYFAPLFNHWNSSALRLNFVARRTRLCPEVDSIITTVNTANHLPDYMASKFRRLQCELYRRASFTYEHDEKHQFDFWIRTCDPRINYVQQTD